MGLGERPQPDRPQRQVALQFRVEKPLKDRRPMGKDISALAVVGNTLFCASDEYASLERLVLDPATGDFGSHETFRIADFFDLPDRRKDELDIEGLAIADGYLWISASHAKRRRPPRDKDRKVGDIAKPKWDGNRGVLGRVPLVDKGNGVFRPKRRTKAPGNSKWRSAAAIIDREDGEGGIRGLVEKDRLLKPFMNVPAKENGFDIEGLAVVGKRVFLGLRGPAVGGRALIVELKLKPGGKGGLKPGKIDGEHYRLHAFDLGGYAMRDLLVRDGRLVILTGPTQSIEGYQRVIVTDVPKKKARILGRTALATLITLDLLEGCDRAEAIAPMPGGDGLLVAYDAPCPRRYDEERHRLAADVFQD
ncbi:DUF3616 domain-containing protein [Oricola sp.]|uniref:DUF3616 domain-containing protein n=1 Tax=Oricola sp. TaxID=1979950 RepID=UPI003BA9505B